MAKTSLAHYNQIPLDQSLEACIWSNHNTFTSFYLHNISEVNKKESHQIIIRIDQNIYAPWENRWYMYVNSYFHLITCKIKILHCCCS